MTQTAPPTPPPTDQKPARRRRAVSLASLVAAVAVPALGLAFFWPARAASSAGGGKFYTVVPIDLDVKVTKDGELQAVDNIEVRCMVEGRNTIVFLIKEGSMVKKGDLLVELDSSLIRQELLEAKLEKQQSEADFKAAEELLSIQRSQNEADTEAAQVQLELAQIALEQFERGTYPQQLKTAETAVRMARITVGNKEQDLAQAKLLYAKGFVTAADVKKAELDLTTVRNGLDEAETALGALTEYTYRMETATRRSAVRQAQQALARVKKTNASLLAKAEADVENKRLAVAEQTNDFEEWTQNLANCKITAPADGLVIYVYDDDNPVAEGATARERQRLIQLPDTAAMKAVVRVSESQSTRLKPGLPATVRVTGLPEPVPARLTKISPVADSDSRAWNPDLKEYPVEVVLERTPPGLKPGLSAQVEVHAAHHANVLAAPLAAIYSDQSTHYVFAQEGDGVVPVRVHLGAASDTHVHVTAGLAPGRNVLLLAPGQGRDLLERAGLDAGAGAGPAQPAGQSVVRAGP